MEATRPIKPARRQLILAALVVAAAIGGWTFQMLALKRLTVPWYVPALGFIGVLLALASFWKSPGVLRGLLALLVATIGGLAGALVIRGSLLPKYDGPIAVGAPFPAFVAERAGGGQFTDADLRGQPTVLTFFRGRW